LAFGEDGCTQDTHFSKLPPTLGSVKSSIPHIVWRFFTFLGILFLLNLEYIWTFMSTVRILFHGKLRLLKIPQVLLV
jgi:hypothetical protein